MTPELLLSRSATRELIRGALRLYVGRGRRFSVKELSNGSGVNDRLIECAMTDPDSADCRPLKQEELLSIISFLGAPFACALLKPCELGAFDLIEGQQIPLPDFPTPDTAETPQARVRRLTRELNEAVEALP